MLRRREPIALIRRYREITELASQLVPRRLRTQYFAGRALVAGLLAFTALLMVLIGGGAALIVDMLDGTGYSAALSSALWGAVGAGTATVAALALMPFIRDGLGLAADVRLMQAASPTHPLMRELMRKAPGTYAHSVATANLAEAGAEEIGADALVARVGSYYHDIGKIRRPCYFYENQRDDENPHDATKPTLSAVIITAHVRDGLALAEEYRLPEKIRDIILQHHGTSLVSYFFNKASVADAQTYEADFRYKGVCPTTREAALVMLADASEASVRALGKPSGPRVKAMVRTIVEEKVADHQLDDAGVSVGDLERIIEVYSRMLVGMCHARCEYPHAADVKGMVISADQHHQPSRA